jgi:hypothetical protein
MKRAFFLLCLAGLLVGCEDSPFVEPEGKKPPAAKADSDETVREIQPTPPIQPAAEPTGEPLRRVEQLQSNGYQPDEALEILLAEIEKNPRAAAEWAATLPPGANRDSCLETVFTEWALIDQNAAVDFARTNLSGMDLTVAAAAIAEVLAADTPESATAALSLVKEPLARGVIADVIARSAAENDPQRAAQWCLLQRDPVERAAAIGALVDVWSSTNLRSAAGWIDSSLQGEEKNLAVEKLISNWASIDPRSAAQWLTDRRANLDYKSHSLTLASGWAMIDPPASARWALGEPDSDLQGSLVKEVASSWALNETAKSIEWANTIGNPEIRRQALLAGFGAMQDDSPAALRAWIQSHPGHPALAEAMESVEEKGD